MELSATGATCTIQENTKGSVRIGTQWHSTGRDDLSVLEGAPLSGYVFS